jgi:hypothetical protein
MSDSIIEQALDVAATQWHWPDLAVLAAAASVLISIMLIMLARLFDLKQLEQTAKKEFVFAASTVFIVIFVVALIQTADGIVVDVGKQLYWDAISFCPDKTSEVCQNLEKVDVKKIRVDSIIDLMLLYMEPPATCTQNFLDVLYIASIPIEACASLFMEIYMSEHMSCFGMKWVAERITNSTQMMTFYMFAYFLLVHVMNFVKYYAGYFFALGIVLRGIPPVRGAGAYLMAISVGFYFVLPFSYILVSTMALPHMQTGNVAAEGVDLDKNSADYGSIKYLCATPAIGDVSGLSCGSGSLSKQLELRAYLKANSSNISSFLGNITDIMLHLISVICVFPLVAFVILFTFVLNTTNLFGGNIPEIGRGLVKLI